MRRFYNIYNGGYTLVEMIVVVVVIAILASVAIRSLGNVSSASRMQKTREAMDRVAEAVAGNPSHSSDGSAADYGYVGDNGCLPSSLDELIQDSHSYVTWNGPYLADLYSDGNSAVYFKLDAWGEEFLYNGLSLTSSGSGTAVTRTIADSHDELLHNRAAFVIVDLNYTPPGQIYKDSVRFSLIYPRNGAILSETGFPDAGGYIEFDSLPVGLHTMHIACLPLNDTITRKVNIEPGSRFYAEIQYPADIWGGSTVSPDTLLWADFDSGSDGFAYGDDLFRGTSRPAYASGVRLSSGGFTGGALQVTVGGIDNGSINNMSGGWSFDFTIPSSTDAILSFRYNLTQTSEYEGDEYSQALVGIDGILYGSFPNDYVAQIIGNGPGGSIITTGWQLFQVDLGTLSAGTHNIMIGTYNNRKTTVNESTELVIDNVLIAVES